MGELNPTLGQKIKWDCKQKDTKKTMMKKRNKKNHMTKLLKVKGNIFFFVLFVESSCEREVREAAKHNRINSKREEPWDQNWVVIFVYKKKEKERKRHI